MNKIYYTIFTITLLITSYLTKTFDIPAVTLLMMNLGLYYVMDYQYDILKELKKMNERADKNEL